MDVRFLGEVSEAFIIENNLYGKLKKEKLQEDLYSLIKEVRDTEIELYDHLYDTNKLQQQKILEAYLKYEYLEEQEVLEEGWLTFGIIALLTYIYQNKINKSIFKTVKNIGKIFEDVGQFLTKHGRYWKFRYAIIQQNAKKCYIRCGVNEQNLSAWSYFSASSKMPALASPESQRQGDCLKECYVTHVIESISLLSKSYFVCLKRSGDWASIKDAKPDDLLTSLSGFI